ncbi:unnamed protein product [Blepharisma stoltei]|uniref:UBA domain-containing protein n=1 Tax=Blepharisma stoltei TaxID=1481888 RepID=A0AAU9JJ06_9CILI|nr:unnamed protein product [Blepharisma stoltei]
MEIRENAEIIKSKLLNIGFDEWKIDLTLQFANSYEEALNYILDADWDNINFVSTNISETRQNEMQTDYGNSATISSRATVNEAHRKSGNIIKEELIKQKRRFHQAAQNLGISEATFKAKIESVETLEELDKAVFEFINQCKLKDKIYTYALEIGLSHKTAKWASVFFDNLENAMEYLNELWVDEKKCKEKNQIYSQAPKNESNIPFLSREEENKLITPVNWADDEADINGDDEDFDEYPRKIYKMFRDIGIEEEKSREMLRECTNMKEAKEMADEYTRFKKHMPFFCIFFWNW